jgi:hypothetical protein
MTWPMLGIAAAIGFALFIASAWRLESPRWAKISALGGWILAVAIGAYQCRQDSRQTPVPNTNRDGMSDEPKDPKSRAWIWWCTIVLLLLYPLSIGPADLALERSGFDRRLQTVRWIVYLPITYLCQKSQTVRDVTYRYARLWIPRPHH